MSFPREASDPRLLGYPAPIVPGNINASHARLGASETLRFDQAGRDPSGEPVEFEFEFEASEISDGAFRTFGALVAVAQLANEATPVKLVGIEEPETALHPAASGALMDARREAAIHSQVVVTTQSADLLDENDPATDRLLVVRSRDGVTEIGPIDRVSREAIEERLDSPDDSLRMDPFEPDFANLPRQSENAVLNP
jgi:hypothetical protein